MLLLIDNERTRSACAPFFSLLSLFGCKGTKKRSNILKIFSKKYEMPQKLHTSGLLSARWQLQLASAQQISMGDGIAVQGLAVQPIVTIGRATDGEGLLAGRV